MNGRRGQDGNVDDDAKEGDDEVRMVTSSALTVVRPSYSITQHRYSKHQALGQNRLALFKNHTAPHRNLPP
jgi:hypothetical protein